MYFKKKRYRTFCLTLILTLLLSCIPFDCAFAVKSEVNAPSLVTTFSSSNTFGDDYCRAEIKDGKLDLKFKTMIPACEFRVALYSPKTKYLDLNTYVPAEDMGFSSIGRRMSGFQYSLDFSDKDIPDGDYFLYISRIENPGDTYEKAPGSGALYKNMILRIQDGKPKILRYKDVITENKRIQAIGADYDPSWYLDEYLEDIRFTLKIPATTIYEDMSSYKISFMRSMSDRITAGATSDYDKLLKLYEYVTSEFYYDSIAFSTHSYQYANPYNNLYNHVNKIASQNSDSQGRVATTCQGFSAIFLSLARAQGIPTRFVFGHRATSPSNSWETEPNIGVRDHWWVESYVDGRWIFIDPTIGTNNKWNKNTNVWQYFGLTNYTYFDPSQEQIAVSHIYHNIYPDKRYGYLITDAGEIETISSFLEQQSSGRKNGLIMNSSYQKDDLKTWGDGYKAHFMGNGYGNTTHIQWSNKGFTGNADFSDMKKLRVFSMHHNKLESVDLSGCSSLENAYLYCNNLSEVDLSGCKNLQFASVTTDNLLQEARLYANNKNITITAGQHGAFQFKYNASNDKEVEVRFKPNIGYKVQGFYNGNNKKLSSSKTYFMNPGWYNYEVRFQLDPDSYEYYLYEGRNGSAIKPYTKAAQKRLKTLGYYDGNIDGIFDSEMTEIVKTYQLVNGIERTGTIASKTWSSLFSSKGKQRPSDEIIQQITDIINTVLDAEAAASKGKVVLTWTKAEDETITTEPAGYQVWKSTSKTSSYKKIGSTKNLKFTNRSNLKENTRYYYKIRAYKTINGKTYYGPWAQVSVKTKQTKEKQETTE